MHPTHNNKWKNTKYTPKECSLMALPSLLKYWEEKRLYYKNEYYKSPKKCKYCNNIIEYDKRYNIFCNNKCAASFNNKGMVRSKKELPTCTICGKKLTKHRKQRLHCYNDYCATIYTINENIANGYDFKKPISTSLIRKYYLAIRERRCEICGNTIWNNQPITIEMHHIDGNAYNNVSENIQLLCPNCHSQTKTYKIKNRGNGKKPIAKRKQRKW